MTEMGTDPGIRGATELFFSDTTPLQRAEAVGGRPYEPRPQQRAMALAVAEHLEHGGHLCVEAPTGVGKTFAYLVPAIHCAQARRLPVVISTHTISLQEQIVEKDLPVLTSLMEVPVRTAIAKGRGNYLCRRRLDAVASLEQGLLPRLGDAAELERLRHWAKQTDDGSLADLDFRPAPQLWDSICCELGNCLAGQCGHFRRCFLRRARRRLAEAEIIVANHALFFTDLAMKRQTGSAEGGILPEYAAVILDEGHTLEDQAATHLGLRLSAFALRRLLWRLYNPERHRGILTDDLWAPARDAVIAATDAMNRFFARLRDWLEQQDQNPLRYTVPNHVPNLLSAPLAEVERHLSHVENDDFEDDRRAELIAARVQLQDYRLGLDSFLGLALADHVYWFERHGRALQQVTLNAVPVEIAPILREQLFAGPTPVIVTSATLAVRGRMAYSQRRLGAEAAEALILDSPFDFAHQVRLYLPFNMPNPKDTAAFVPAACEQIRRFVQKTDGKAFVLFTSYRMMHDIAERLAGFFESAGIQLLVQGEGLPRTRMLDLFRQDTDSVIFGTASFWTGVDVPGAALSNVILVKLPFAVPDHPLTAARQELIEQHGGRAFWEYSLPEAILRFRQGFGRLIRSRDDHGIVVILDTRIVRTSYGKAFLDSLPECRRSVF